MDVGNLQEVHLVALVMHVLQLISQSWQSGTVINSSKYSLDKQGFGKHIA